MARRVRNIESERIDNSVACAYLARIAADSAEAAAILAAMLEKTVVLDGQIITILVLTGAIVVVLMADRELTAKLELQWRILAAATPIVS